MAKKWVMRSPLEGTSQLITRIERAEREGKEFLVYFDPDLDGLVAGLFWIMLLNKRNLPFKWYINPDRKHGFLLPEDSIKNKVIVNGDFTITEEQIKKLVENDNTVLCVDHHDCASPSLIEVGSVNDPYYGLYMTNQYSFELPELRYQSGAGVVAEVLMHLEPALFNNQTVAGLIGATLLSDVRDIENPFAKHYLTALYEHPYEGIIKFLIDAVMQGKRDWGFGVPRMSRHFVDFYLSPTLNGLLRFNRHNEAVRLILGEKILIKNAQQRQREIVKDIVKHSEVLEGKSFAFLRCDMRKIPEGVFPKDVNLSNFIGLACSHLANNLDKSLLGTVIDEDGNKVRSSFRGRLEGVDYRGLTYEFLQGQGHSGAFGVREFSMTRQVFTSIDSAILSAEKEVAFAKKIVEVENLSVFVNGGRAHALAKENEFKLRQNQTYVKYSGWDISKVGQSGNPTKFYEKFLVNGVEVMNFVPGLNFGEGLLSLSLDRSSLSFTLVKK